MSTLLQTGSPTQAARFEALLRASKAIASSGDCGNCEEVFARELRSAISFDYLHVSMFESDRGSSCNSGWRLFDIHGSKRQIPEADLPVDEIELMSSLVHEDGQPLVVADWSKEARFPHLKVFITGLGINSTCMLPLVRGQRRLGVFEVGNTQRNAYCNEEVAFLSFAADQVALSIDAAVNFAVSQQAQERLKLLLELTNQVVSNLELRKLLRAASASLRRVMNCDVVGVMLPHPDGGQLQIYALDFPDGKGLFREESLIPIEGSHPGEVFRTGKPLLKKQHELEGNGPPSTTGGWLERVSTPAVWYHSKAADVPSASWPWADDWRTLSMRMKLNSSAKLQARWLSPWKTPWLMAKLPTSATNSLRRSCTWKTKSAGR